MTLDQCYQANVGQAVLVPGGGGGNNGQCEQWMDLVYHDVYGLPYVYTPAAKDFWYKADQLGITQHFDKITDGTVKKGDFVIYDPVNPSDTQGHGDLAAQDGTTKSYVGYDSNWGNAYNAQGYPILHTVTHADQYNKFILGSLRLKGQTMSVYDAVPTQTDIKKHYETRMFREPTTAELNIGHTWGQILDDNVTELGTRLKAAENNTPGFTPIAGTVYQKNAS